MLYSEQYGELLYPLTIFKSVFTILIHYNKLNDLQSIIIKKNIILKFTYIFTSHKILYSKFTIQCVTTF